MNERPPMVVVDRLVKTYPKKLGWLARLQSGKRNKVDVLKGISFTVGDGELLGVLGANGAGKTTLLHSLAALAYWDSGTITIGGIDARTDPMAVRRIVGVSTVYGGFYGRLTVRENLRFFAALSDVTPKNVERRIDEVLELVNLRDVDSRRYFTLSSGMRQRLFVSRALLSDPKLVLLDEPTRAVDPVNAELLRNFIRHTLVTEMGKTVILATNLLDEAWSLCDRVAVLREGQIAAVASPESLQTKAAGTQRYRIVVDRVDDEFLAAIRLVPGFTSLATLPRGDDIRIDVEIMPLEFSLTSLLHAISSEGVEVREFTFEGSRPADVFAALTAPRA